MHTDSYIQKKADYIQDKEIAKKVPKQDRMVSKNNKRSRTKQTATEGKKKVSKPLSRQPCHQIRPAEHNHFCCNIFSAASQ